MRTLRHITTILLTLLLVSLVVSPVAAVRAGARSGEPLVLVVSPKLDVQDLSLAEVRRVFGGDPTYVGGKRLVPFNYKAGDPVRAAFDRVALGLEPDAVARYWVDRRMRGQSQPPRSVPNPDFMVAVAERLVGAIGYVPVSALSPKVRALTVDGLAYDAPDYPLRVDLSADR